jgi:hypothetical protein
MPLTRSVSSLGKKGDKVEIWPSNHEPSNGARPGGWNDTTPGLRQTFSFM